MNAPRTPTRQPKGQPTGGQFAAKANPECETELDIEDARFEAACRVHNACLGEARIPHIRVTALVVCWDSYGRILAEREARCS